MDFTTGSLSDCVDFPGVKKDTLQTLMEIACVAIGRGMQSAAEDIFNGISAVRPQSELPIIGLAVAKMCFGDFKSASKLICEKALVLNPSSDLAKCFLGIVSFYCGALDEASCVLSGVMADSKDEITLKIAQSVTEEINNKQKERR